VRVAGRSNLKSVHPVETHLLMVIAHFSLA
jgi:hypothetical protein